ncbi:MAG: hypothetical protein KDB10_19610 [Acidimicrobiales bacterium]|nr:hypothetical protein [Acidimicrobiales bacterium]MCB9372452.1 hypothetical protein [Microthrixaceae bacterium]
MSARRATSGAGAPASLLVAALAYGAATQGAFHARQYLVLLALCGTSLGLEARARRARPAPGSGEAVPWQVAAVLASGALVVGLAHGSLVEVLPALSLVGVIVTGLAVAGGSAAAAGALRAGLVVVGTAVAGTGWLGVVLHRAPWGKVIAGLWRGAGPITYVNATAALLSMALLVALAWSVEAPGRPRRLAAWALTVGLLLTLSRAGIAAAVLGVVLLGALLGARRVGAVVVGLAPAVAVTLAAAAPSMAEVAPSRLPLAVAGLVAGGLLAAGRRSAGAALALTAALVVAGGMLLSVSADGRDALDQLGTTRVGIASPDRTHEWQLARDRFAAAPVAGHAPLADPYQWQGGDGRWFVAPYAHNEYLDLLAAYGLVGAVALTAAIAVVVRAWRRTGARGRPDPARAGAAAALAAFAVHSAFDFLWHVPVLVLAAAVLAGRGLLVPEPHPTAKEPT